MKMGVEWGGGGDIISCAHSNWLTFKNNYWPLFKPIVSQYQHLNKEVCVVSFSPTYSIIVRHLYKDWSLIKGREGLQNGEIAGQKLFAPPSPLKTG